MGRITTCDNYCFLDHINNRLPLSQIILHSKQSSTRNLLHRPAGSQHSDSNQVRCARKHQRSFGSKRGQAALSHSLAVLPVKAISWQMYALCRESGFGARQPFPAVYGRPCAENCRHTVLCLYGSERPDGLGLPTSPTQAVCCETHGVNLGDGPAVSASVGCSYQRIAFCGSWEC